jgi:hypothetical protein
VFLHALHYLQTVTDCATDAGVHKEPGLWVHVPKTVESPSEAYVRQAAIPHGGSLLAQSTFVDTLAYGPRHRVCKLLSVSSRRSDSSSQ